MKKAPNTEVDNLPLADRNKRERESDEDPLQFPGDLRPEWERENSEISDRKPDLEEIEEDTSVL
jgi:hypothetical protein